MRAASSPLLAAKRLQDVAQSYGCEDNVSVLVLRLGALTAAVPSAAAVGVRVAGGQSHELSLAASQRGHRGTNALAVSVQSASPPRDAMPRNAV